MFHLGPLMAELTSSSSDDGLPLTQPPTKARGTSVSNVVGNSSSGAGRGANGAPQGMTGTAQQRTGPHFGINQNKAQDSGVRSKGQTPNFPSGPENGTRGNPGGSRNQPPSRPSGFSQSHNGTQQAAASGLSAAQQMQKQQKHAGAVKKVTNRSTAAQRKKCAPKPKAPKPRKRMWQWVLPPHLKAKYLEEDMLFARRSTFSTREEPGGRISDEAQAQSVAGCSREETRGGPSSSSGASAKVDDRSGSGEKVHNGDRKRKSSGSHSPVHQHRHLIQRASGAERPQPFVSPESVSSVEFLGESSVMALEGSSMLASKPIAVEPLPGGAVDERQRTGPPPSGSRGRGAATSSHPENSRELVKAGPLAVVPAVTNVQKSILDFLSETIGAIKRGGDSGGSSRPTSAAKSSEKKKSRFCINDSDSEIEVECSRPKQMLALPAPVSMDTSGTLATNQVDRQALQRPEFHPDLSYAYGPRPSQSRVNIVQSAINAVNTICRRMPEKQPASVDLSGRLNLGLKSPPKLQAVEDRSHNIASAPMESKMGYSAANGDSNGVVPRLRDNPNSCLDPAKPEIANPFATVPFPDDWDESHPNIQLYRELQTNHGLRDCLNAAIQRDMKKSANGPATTTAMKGGRIGEISQASSSNSSSGRQEGTYFHDGIQTSRSIDPYRKDNRAPTAQRHSNVSEAGAPSTSSMGQIARDGHGVSPYKWTNPQLSDPKVLCMQAVRNKGVPSAPLKIAGASHAQATSSQKQTPQQTSRAQGSSSARPEIAFAPKPPHRAQNPAIPDRAHDPDYLPIGRPDSGRYIHRLEFAAIQQQCREKAAKKRRDDRIRQQQRQKIRNEEAMAKYRQYMASQAAAAACAQEMRPPRPSSVPQKAPPQKKKGRSPKNPTPVLTTEHIAHIDQAIDVVIASQKTSSAPFSTNTAGDESKVVPPSTLTAVQKEVKGQLHHHGKHVLPGETLKGHSGGMTGACVVKDQGNGYAGTSSSLPKGITGSKSLQAPGDESGNLVGTGGPHSASNKISSPENAISNEMESGGNFKHLVPPNDLLTASAKSILGKIPLVLKLHETNRLQSGNAKNGGRIQTEIGAATSQAVTAVEDLVKYFWRNGAGNVLPKSRKKTSRGLMLKVQEAELDDCRRLTAVCTVLLFTHAYPDKSVSNRMRGLDERSVLDTVHIAEAVVRSIQKQLMERCANTVLPRMHIMFDTVDQMFRMDCFQRGIDDPDMPGCRQRVVIFGTSAGVTRLAASKHWYVATSRKYPPKGFRVFVSIHAWSGQAEDAGASNLAPLDTVKPCLHGALASGAGLVDWMKFWNNVRSLIQGDRSDTAAGSGCGMPASIMCGLDDGGNGANFAALKSIFGGRESNPDLHLYHPYAEFLAQLAAKARELGLTSSPNGQLTTGVRCLAAMAFVPPGDATDRILGPLYPLIDSLKAANNPEKTSVHVKTGEAMLCEWFTETLAGRIDRLCGGRNSDGRVNNASTSRALDGPDVVDLTESPSNALGTREEDDDMEPPFIESILRWSVAELVMEDIPVYLNNPAAMWIADLEQNWLRFDPNFASSIRTLSRYGEVLLAENDTRVMPALEQQSYATRVEFVKKAVRDYAEGRIPFNALLTRLDAGGITTSQK